MAHYITSARPNLGNPRQIEGLLPTTNSACLASELVPERVKGRLLAGHLVTGRIQNLLPAYRTQSLLVSATWRGGHALVRSHNSVGAQASNSWFRLGKGRTVAILRSVLRRSLFTILAF